MCSEYGFYMIIGASLDQDGRISEEQMDICTIMKMR
jgi:hypothetical protein